MICLEWGLADYYKCIHSILLHRVLPPTFFFSLIEIEPGTCPQVLPLMEIRTELNSAGSIFFLWSAGSRVEEASHKNSIIYWISKEHANFLSLPSRNVTKLFLYVCDHNNDFFLASWWSCIKERCYQWGLMCLRLLRKWFLTFFVSK